MNNYELVYHMNEIRKLYATDFSNGLRSMGNINITIGAKYMNAVAFEKNDDENKLIDVTIWDR